MKAPVIGCKRCMAKLAEHDSAGVTLKRGELQAVVSGQFQLSIVCYRCGQLNALGAGPPCPTRSAA